MQFAFAAALALALGRIAARLVMDGRRPMVPITYTAGPVVSGTVGATLLEMSRAAGVPHASICGGRARCSTCRVRIVDGLEQLPPPEFAETVTLGTIGAPDGVRLACQIRPTAPLTVTRLVGAATAAGRTAGGANGEDRGVERRLAVMFLDIRGFTALAEHRLPYDVVFLLNSFYARIGAAIADEGGWIDKYMGDGLLAVFGRDTGGTEGSRSALNAAVAIDRALDILEDDLAGEGYQHLGVGIGHIGYGEAARMTVIGATVNLASRLESATRERNCQLIVSRALADEAGWNGDGGRLEAITVRGHDVPVEVFVVDRAHHMRLDAMPAAPPDDLPRTAGA
jgi:adenylate cyclase